MSDRASRAGIAVLLAVLAAAALANCAGVSAARSCMERPSRFAQPEKS